MTKKTGRRSELAEKVCRHLREQEWAQAGLRVGVAVSGGADSVALLLLLLELREQLGLVVSVVHFNHQLRGAASDTDEKFVSKLAAKHGLSFVVKGEDIARKAKRERANLEDAARRARYGFFERLAVDGQLDRIAVAHTADDQAETVLGHVLRGTGLAGLGGIHPVSGCVFRPLLTIRREELRAYLRSRRQVWREDATNRDTKRMRARIRNKLIPLLEKQFQPAVVDHLCQFADLAREDDAWMDEQAEARVHLTAKEDNGGWRIAISDLVATPLIGAERTSSKGGADRKEHHLTGTHRQERSEGHAVEAVSKRMIRVLAKKVKLRAGQLSSVHVDAVLQLALQADAGKSLHLPGGVEVRRIREWLCFRPMNEWSAAKCPPTAYSYAVDLRSGTAEVRVKEATCRLRFTVIDWPAEGRDTKLTGPLLDRDALGVSLIVRNWRPGDALQAVGHQKHHKLSRLLNELGVSRWEKVSWPVLEAQGRVAWARGLPAAAEFAAAGGTRTALVVSEISLTEQ